jgi:hypothetical protein
MRHYMTLAVWAALATSCARPADPAVPRPGVEPAPRVAAARPEPSATLAAESPPRSLPVPEAVARLHRRAFRGADGSDDRPLCFVTLHESSAEPASIFPLVLFENGDVATWTQTPAGPQQPFFAKLNASDLARATELVSTLSRLPPTPAREFEVSTGVMGASTHRADVVETRFFEDRQLPSALAELVGLLKSHLEAENAPPSAP